MRAIILVGGLGTRLRPLTVSRPKPLLPILNRPFFTYQLELLRAGGVTEVALAVGQFIPQWRKALREWTPRGMTVHIARETKPLGTGGAIRHAFDRVFSRRKDGAGDPIVVLNGDVFLDLNVSQFARAARKARAWGAIAVHRVSDARAFGLVEAGSSGLIKAFREKPKIKKPGWINAGAYLLSPDLIRSFPRKPHSIERDVFPDLLKKKIPLAAFRLKGYWNDIGTIPTYLGAHADLASSRRDWTKLGRFGVKGSPAGGPFRLLRGRKRGDLVGKAAGSRLDRAVKTAGFVMLGPRAGADSGSDLRNVILYRNAKIGRNCRLENVVVGENARIGDNSIIIGPVGIGDGTRLTKHSRLG